MSPSPILGQICIDFERLINQKIYESSSKDGCKRKTAEFSAKRPNDLFCVVQLPDSYLSGKKDETCENVGCVPFIKDDFKFGKGSEWTLIPDLILEIYHSHGVMVENTNYNLSFSHLGLQFNQEQLKNMKGDSAAVAWLSTRPNYTLLAQEQDANSGAFDKLKEHQEAVFKKYVTSCRNPLQRTYVQQ